MISIKKTIILICCLDFKTVCNPIKVYWYTKQFISNLILENVLGRDLQYIFGNLAVIILHWFINDVALIFLTLQFRFFIYF